jgi:hypothetical protein
MKKTKNSTPSSEWESKDRCPSCGSFCDVHKDLDENDECNDCRSSKTALEYILNLVVGEDEQGKDVRVKDTLSKSEIDKAKGMDKQEKIDFADKYGTYLLQGGIMSTAAYNETFKSE